MQLRRSIRGLKFLNQTMALLLLLLIPGLSILQVAAYKYQRHLLKSQLEKEWVSQLGETLFLPNTDEFSEIQSGDEIELGGKKYDVITVAKVESGYCVLAFEDNVEKMLESHASDISAYPLSKNNQKSSGVWFSKVKWDVPGDADHLFSLTSTDLGAIGFVSAFLPDVFFDVDSPPPRLFS